MAAKVFAEGKNVQQLPGYMGMSFGACVLSEF